MAQGPMSVGSPDVIKFITDKTLTQEDVAADAKKVGEVLSTKFPAAGGTFGGDIGFSQIGGTGVSNKLVYPTAAGNVRVYAQTVGNGTARLVLDIPAGTDTRVVIGKNGAQMSYFDQNGVFHGNLEGTASYATNAGDAESVNGFQFSREKDNEMQNVLLIGESGTSLEKVARFRTLQSIFKESLADYGPILPYGGYARFQNGLQIVWGEGTANGFIAFPRAFIDTTYNVSLTPVVDVKHDFYVVISGRSNTGITVKQDGITGTDKCTYIAVGWWRYTKEIEE